MTTVVQEHRHPPLLLLLIVVSIVWTPRPPPSPTSVGCWVSTIRAAPTAVPTTTPHRKSSKPLIAMAVVPVATEVLQGDDSNHGDPQQGIRETGCRASNCGLVSVSNGGFRCPQVWHDSDEQDDSENRCRDPRGRPRATIVLILPWISWVPRSVPPAGIVPSVTVTRRRRPSSHHTSSTFPQHRQDLKLVNRYQ